MSKGAMAAVNRETIRVIKNQRDKALDKITCLEVEMALVALSAKQASDTSVRMGEALGVASRAATLLERKKLNQKLTLGSLQAKYDACRHERDKALVEIQNLRDATDAHKKSALTHLNEKHFAEDLYSGALRDNAALAAKLATVVGAFNAWEQTIKDYENRPRVTGDSFYSGRMRDARKVLDSACDATTEPTTEALGPPEFEPCTSTLNDLHCALPEGHGGMHSAKADGGTPRWGTQDLLSPIDDAAESAFDLAVPEQEEVPCQNCEALLAKLATENHLHLATQAQYAPLLVVLVELLRAIDAGEVRVSAHIEDVLRTSLKITPTEALRARDAQVWDEAYRAGGTDWAHQHHAEIDGVAPDSPMANPYAKKTDDADLSDVKTFSPLPDTPEMRAIVGAAVKHMRKPADDDDGASTNALINPTMVELTGEPKCQCHQEIGDSECPVPGHNTPDESTPKPGTDKMHGAKGVGDEEKS